MPKNTFNVRNLVSTNIPNEIRPIRGWGSHFTTNYGFALKLPYNNTLAVFVDDRLTNGKADQALKVLSQGGIIARIISCEGKVWRVNAEATQKGQHGITVFTEKDKPIMAGQLSVSGAGRITFSVSTL